MLGVTLWGISLHRSTLPHWAWQLVVIAVILVVAFGVLALLQRLLHRWGKAPIEGTGDLIRARRRETALGLVTSMVRYFVFAVTLFVLLGFLLRSVVTAAAGAGLLVAILAFGAQRFLQDVIAGVFILLENQYGVGDFITLEPMSLSGVVEEIGLRTTILRNLNGDRYIIPNGQITAVRRAVKRFRRYTIDLLTHDPAAAEQALEDLIAVAPVGSARFLRRPEIVEQREVSPTVSLVRIRADVPPTMEWLVEQYLVKVLATRLEGSLVAQPLVYTLDEAAVRRYERTVVLR